MSRIPGLADLRIAEPLDYPAFKVDVDRTKALEVGVTEQQVASSLLSPNSTALPCSSRISGSIRKTASTTALSLRRHIT